MIISSLNKIRIAFVALLVLLSVGFTGCKENEVLEGNANNETSMLPETSSNFTQNPMIDDSGFRVGQSVSDAYVDPSTVNKIPAEQIKAKGYEYDYDSLTYELVWSDEFDYEGELDTSKWGYDLGQSGWGNNELEKYTKTNAVVGDGMLTIHLRKEEDGTVTSSRVATRQKGDWVYGKFEICAKLPSGKGTWPAIWMLPTDYRYGSWPDSGEIDIMEHVGYHQDYVSSSVHTKSYNHKIGTQKTKEIKLEGASEEFHVYCLEWLPDKIITYVDGNKLFEFVPTKYKTEPTKDEWPFDKRHHLLINLAWGGDWGGARGVDESILPQEFQIEYVRVYQSPEINAITGQK
ncbi:MAG: glycoside hydrolase family 16 protein [Lachnospiraceae bacterium]|nr:glycoside hydrolase family 16 protein [Lachnospiraceae bacterium]